jgi:xanthosine utilization system XapX-like protein
LLAAYGANLVSPPPPSVPALAIVALIGAALGFALAYWVDRHRIPVQP